MHASATVEYQSDLKRCMLWISKKDTIRNRISLRYVNVLIKQYIQLNVTKRHRQEKEKS